MNLDLSLQARALTWRMRTSSALQHLGKGERVEENGSMTYLSHEIIYVPERGDMLSGNDRTQDTKTAFFESVLLLTPLVWLQRQRQSLGR